jgi:CRP/FNR family transcriptional regulator, polysaccharide utilization system transcription regulator
MKPMILSEDCVNCKVKFSGFEALKPEELTGFKESHRKIDYNKGETIIKQGTSSNNLVCFRSGFAKVYLEGIDGKSIIIKVLKQGDFILSPGIFNDYINHFSVTAITTCETCLINVDAFEKTFGKNSAFAQMILQQNHQLINYLHQQLIKISFKKMNGRVADTLIYLSEQIYQSTNFYTTLTRQDLADMSGVSKESFIRIMKDLKDSGILDIEGNRIEIHSLPQLNNISKVG